MHWDLTHAALVLLPFQKRPRAADSPAAVESVAPVVASAPTSSSVADAVFDLKDEELDPSTLRLWSAFHDGCWCTSCPVHATPSKPESFFQLGSALLTALYRGLNFGDDLFRTLQFAAQHQAKTEGGVRIDVGEYTPSATSDGDAAATDSLADSAIAAVISSDPSLTCSWHAAGNSLLHAFEPLLPVVLIGPFKVLAGHFRRVPPQKVHPFLLDRFFYDSPEVWSVLQLTASPADAAAAVSSSATAASTSSSSSSTDSLAHYAYYRDDPRNEFPAAFVGRLTATSPAITLVGPNLLSALMAIIDDQLEASGGSATTAKKKKVDPTQTTLFASADATPSTAVTLETMRADLDSFGQRYGLTLTAKGGKRPPPKRDSAWTKREKKVVCDLDNKAGLVVPFSQNTHAQTRTGLKGQRRRGLSATHCFLLLLTHTPVPPVFYLCSFSCLPLPPVRGRHRLASGELDE